MSIILLLTVTAECLNIKSSRFCPEFQIVQSYVDLGDSMLRTLRSDAKINILNPSWNVKMFNKGVQTYLESDFSVPFVPNKKIC